MGHFGRRPIQLSWYCWVFPALLLNYFGQAALFVDGPGSDREPVLPSGPGLGDHAAGDPRHDGHGDRLAGVDLRSVLDDGPGDSTSTTSPGSPFGTRRASHVGQIYVPLVNWLLMIGCVGLVLGFRSSSALAAAYGIAVTATMAITTLLFYRVARDRFGWSIDQGGDLSPRCSSSTSPSSPPTCRRSRDGGWFPLAHRASSSSSR